MKFLFTVCFLSLANQNAFASVNVTCWAKLGEDLYSADSNRVPEDHSLVPFRDVTVVLQSIDSDVFSFGEVVTDCQTVTYGIKVSPDHRMELHVRLAKPSETIEEVAYGDLNQGVEFYHRLSEGKDVALYCRRSPSWMSLSR